jgi:hypothetical protein
MKKILTLFLSIGSIGFGVADEQSSACSNFVMDNGGEINYATTKTEAVFFNDYDKQMKRKKGHCPDLMKKECMSNKTLAAGSHVLISKSFRDFNCVGAVNAKQHQEKSGWIETNKLQTKSLPAFNSQLLLGTWVNYDSKIIITKNGLNYHAIGESYWAKNQSFFHVGSFDISFVPPQANNFILHERENAVTLQGTLFYTESAIAADDKLDCLVKIKLFNDVMYVEDNLHCGGANVSFNGLYTKVNSK